MTQISRELMVPRIELPRAIHQKMVAALRIPEWVSIKTSGKWSLANVTFGSNTASSESAHADELLHKRSASWKISFNPKAIARRGTRASSSGKRHPCGFATFGRSEFACNCAAPAEIWHCSIWPLTASCAPAISSNFASEMSRTETAWREGRLCYSRKPSGLCNSRSRSRRVLRYRLGWRTPPCAQIHTCFRVACTIHRTSRRGNMPELTHSLVSRGDVTLS